MMALAALISALAWPTVAVWALWYFQTPLVQLLGRIKKAGIAGASVDLAVEQQAGAPEVARALGFPPPTDAHPVYTEGDKLIAEHLSKVGTSAEQQLPLAIRWLSVAWFQHYAEVVYRLIFGSQLTLLKTLSVGKQPSGYALLLYSQVKTAFPEFYGVYSFDQWSGFLKTATLVSEGDGHLSITPRGREFLEYLRTNGISENKPF